MTPARGSGGRGGRARGETPASARKAPAQAAGARAGYSGTPLARKLGVRAGASVLLVGASRGFEATLEGLPADARVTRRARAGARHDVIVLFATRRERLAQTFERLVPALAEDGGLWACWPKRASGVTTDLGDGAVRALGLATGLVDNKVCAVDATWSGLRFVRRLADRGG